MVNARVDLVVSYLMSSLLLYAPLFKMPTSLLNLHESAAINLSDIQFTDSDTTTHHAYDFIPQG